MQDEETSASDPEKPAPGAPRADGRDEKAPPLGNEPDDAGESAGDIASDEGGKSSGGSPPGDTGESGDEEGSKSSYVPSPEENKE